MPTVVMRVISANTYQTTSWKNGGGITHEIAIKSDASRILWRLSVAEVGSDGPFSYFEGLSRVLTVIEGAGLLLVGQGKTFHADLFRPVAFSGSLPITGVLNDGPIRDFNLIYNSDLIEGRVDVLKGGELSTFAKPNQTHALFAAHGIVKASGVEIAVGDCGFWNDEAVDIELSDDGFALLVSLNSHD